MRVVFAGTPEFALPSLDALAASEHELACVVTQPDRPAGRGRKPAAAPVKQRAAELGLALRQPPSLKDDAAYEALAALAPDVIAVVAYGLLLPQRVLDLPRYGCINLHPSLLPRWRGAAPIQRAILAGDVRTGVTIMQVDSGLDSGPVYLRREVEIGPETTSGELHDTLADMGAAAMLEVLAGLPQGLTAAPQDDGSATYAEQLSKQEARIDWRDDAHTIARRVRGFAPWPVAFALLDDQPLRIWRARAVGGAGAARPGSVVAASAHGIDVATGDGVLRMLRLQLPGKRRMDAASAVNGRDWTGLCLE